VEIRPDYAPGLNRLANGYTRLRMYSDAVATIEKAIDLAPNRPEHPVSLGMIQIELNLVHRAGESFQRALELDPDLASAHHGMAELARREGRYSEALRSVDLALADSRLQAAGRRELETYRETVRTEQEEYNRLEDAVTAENASADDYRSLAGIHAMRREWKLAAELLDRAGPEADQAVLGYYLLKAERYSDAADLYAAIPGLENDAGLLINRGIALANLGRNREAEESYRRALELDQGNPDAWLYLGNALVRLRENDAAVEAFGKFLELGARHTASEQVRRIVLQLTGDGS
jgi:tetratricopeptide (TPR) repeat protein